jgi:hypothetical protein
MGRSAEFVFSVELKIAMVMPLLKCEGKALIVKKFRVKLVVSWGGDKDDLVVVSMLGVARAEEAFGFSVGDGSDLEEE